MIKFADVTLEGSNQSIVIGVALIAMAYCIVVFWGVELVHFDR